MIIRPIQMSDLDTLMELAEKSGVGVTTLPNNRDLLEERILRSEKSFKHAKAIEYGEYIFALEDPEQGKVVGISAIISAVGMEDVWYAYRLGKNVNASKEIGVHTTNELLYLTNDQTGSSEVCSLFLDEDYRTGQNGRLLSKCRFLFMRDFPQLFNEKVIAEMRGYSDEHGRSPFWESLGKKFFQMEFSKADYLSGLGNKSFVAELMPKHPIYTAFLSDEARSVIGKVHRNTEPALAMLKKEGFHFNGFIDIFDGGPVVEAFLSSIRAVQESSIRQALVVKHPRYKEETDEYHLVSNSGLENFRAMLVPSEAVDFDTVSLTQENADLLQVRMGEPVRVVPLRYRENL